MTVMAVWSETKKNLWITDVRESATVKYLKAMPLGLMPILYHV